MPRSGLILSCSAAVNLIAAGCSGNALPTLPALPSLPDIAAALSPSPVVGPPTDIYARIARGALACWFGTEGPLKANYIYHAEADPPARGGKAEIVIRERDSASDSKRGIRAFRIQIAPDGEASALTIENLNLPAPLAQALEMDVRQWAAGAIGCARADGNWVPRPPEPSEDPDNGKTRARQDRAT